MRRRLVLAWAVVAAGALAACGVKAPPRPPVREPVTPAPAPTSNPTPTATP